MVDQPASTEGFVESRQCRSCGIDVPANCVRCRTCGEILSQDVKKYHAENLDTPGARQWYTFFDGQEFGPFSTKELRWAISSKSTLKEALVWKPGLESWVPVARVAELVPE